MKNTIVGIIIGALLVVVAFLGYNNIKLRKTATASPTNTTADSSNTGVDAINPTVSVDVSTAPMLGDKSKTKIAIVEFSDYECPYCKRFHQESYDQIINNYVNNNKIVFFYRNYPLDFHQPAASVDATAALCVRELGDDKKYFQMSQSIYLNTKSNGNGIASDTMIGLATSLGVNKDSFASCLSSNKYQAQINKDENEGSAIGVQGTPAFVIGTLDNNKITGQLIGGAQPYSTFQSAISALTK